MASNNKNGKRKVEEEVVYSAVVRKRLRFSSNNGGDDSSDELVDETEVETEEAEETEDVSSEESSMNQLDTCEEKLMAQHGRGLFFGDDSDTSLIESKPHSLETPSSHVRSDPDSSDDDDNDFWM
jgi:hypothetical protein